MPTDARIREDLGPAGLRWITSLRAPAIRGLASGGDLQLSIFDKRDLAEISAPEIFPGERLIVCRNPLLAAERARKREALLAATEVRGATASASTTRTQISGWADTESDRNPAAQHYPGFRVSGAGCSSNRATITDCMSVAGSVITPTTKSSAKYGGGSESNGAGTTTVPL